MVKPPRKETTMKFTVTTLVAPGLVSRNAVSAALALSFALSSAPAVLAADGVHTSIDYPGAIMTVGRGVSPEGTIVGWYRAPDHSQHGYILQNGVFSTINFPGASTTTTDGGPNPKGDVVGNYVDGNGVPHGHRLSAMAAVEGINTRVERDVRVYMNSDLNTRGVLYQAQARAAKAFAEVGVRIEWRIGRPSGTQPERESAIVIHLAEQAPADYLAGALAFAKVYEGVHITVFWDRIECQRRFAPPVVVLAHVLVHEITHILQGVDRHSESGVMKSQWTAKDQHAMASKPLQFTPLDVQLIAHGLDSRRDARTRAGWIRETPARLAPRRTAHQCNKIDEHR
jgi:hypothetical protein